jgi:hypothetical protein
MAPMRAAAEAALAAALAVASALAGGAPALAAAQEAPPPPPPSAEEARPPRAPVAPGDGALPPPRGVAPPPAAPVWPADLTRRTSLGVNVLGLVPGPEDGSDGTWRAEVVLEAAFRPRVGLAAIFSGGQVRKDGHDVATTVGFTAQYRWYFSGRFDRGGYLAGAVGFWLIDPYAVWSLGGGVGYKRTFTSGFTLDLQAGLQLPVDWFRSDDDGDPPDLEDAWRALIPGPLVSVGGSFGAPEGKGTPRSPR